MTERVPERGPERGPERVPLGKYLANLGYGTRREVTYLMTRRRVTDREGTVLGITDRRAHEDVRVDGAPLDPPPQSAVLLHKPLGYVCSTTDNTHPVIYDLLPPQFRLRKPLMAPVGRLDADTSGLLIVTDDGTLNHRLTSPRRHVPKTYVATLAEPLRGDEVAQFASGTLMLEAEAKPLLPVHAEVLTPTTLQLTLHEGRYHQVRRMCAAVGHRVTQLTRIAVGALPLEPQSVGTWRVLTPAEVALLTGSP